MMGGLGSGRRGGWGRDKVECCRSLDVNKLHREGCLSSGRNSKWQFERNGSPIGVIDIRAEQDHIYLEYRVRSRSDDWQDVAEVVGLVRRPCRFGGERLYFVCPGENGASCSRSVWKLYRAGRLFLCRRCSKLAYVSQCEDAGMRFRRRARKTLRRLDGDTSSWLSASRPKGMWRRTFERLRRKAFDSEWDAEELADRRYAQLTRRVSRR
jgi:hypothetical protein